ncbi:MAG: transcription-repair coupling factor [Alphaproteobacteria bacterium]|nr:transcription-repair coupling factor [Alphaproteobacteria bacterium]
MLALFAARRPGRGLLHIALDDARAARLAWLLAFFAPETEVVQLPAWDCLPYDRVSPNPEIVARRIAALSRLAGGLDPKRPTIVITTVNAALQRVPPRLIMGTAGRPLRIGDRLDLDELQATLVRHGYSRAQTVREPGEFAFRGGIVDLFPPGTEEPLRLDFFGDELDTIRSFDSLSQRTTGKRDEVGLEPMAELFLDSESIARFRAGYRELFGAVTDDDPLYEAVSEGRRYTGMEHWLPLFHAEMETLFDYLPDAMVTLDHQLEQARDARIGQVAEFYEARQTFQTQVRASAAPVYKPLPPDRLYLDADAWAQAMAGRPIGRLSPFGAPSESGDIVDAGARKGRDFADVRAKAETNVFDEVRQHARALEGDGRRIVIAGYTTGARERLRHLMREHGVADIAAIERWAEAADLPPRQWAAAVLPLESGILAPDIAVITEQDILGDRLTRPVKKRKKADAFISEVSSLSPGDVVVHSEHGFGRYDGLETLTISGGAPHDCLKVVYADNDKLFIPVENIEVLSRFGPADSEVPLDKLGGAGWQARKAKVKKRLKDMADELMRVAAARQTREAEPLPPPDGVYEEFAARFPYPETDDQLRAIEDVLQDLQAGKPMDRLVCGDVGFGKTEVALRAAFLAAMNGVQVAVVVPTTLLARQHHRTFRERFQGLPLNLAQLSRMVGAKESKAVRDGLTDGSVDIVVGTHALLSQTVKFKRLGLIVVDEEQHFGVKQKERLKQLRHDVHVLTLTATPIPRTLQLALTGVRELSLIATPPVDRLAVRTFVLPFDPVVIREAILREHFRGGQTYYVCPRIEDLADVEEELKALVPEVKIVTAHGRMAASRLEEVMSAFYDGQFDVLLSTSIVESGLDVPTANTLVVHRADMFGLAQLYQLRGRIGRSKVRGYAYLTYQPRRTLSKTSQQRLNVIETLDTLGAGFSLASHDMDIRGAGNLLGEEQSGHIREVGAELYQQLLQEAVAAAKDAETEEAAEQWTPQINLGMPVLIPEDYVADLHVRLDLYRRVARLVDQSEIDSFAAELVDRFGTLPGEVENLLTVVALKQLCRAAGVERLDAGPRGAVVTFRNNSFAKPDRLVAYLTKQAGAAKLRPDHKLVVTRAWDDLATRIQGARKFMQNLAKLAA